MSTRATIWLGALYQIALWPLAAGAITASWLLDVPALAAIGVCCAMGAFTVILLVAEDRTRTLIRVTSGLQRPEAEVKNLR